MAPDEYPFCLSCGSLIHDKSLHASFHRRLRLVDEPLPAVGTCGDSILIRGERGRIRKLWCGVSNTHQVHEQKYQGRIYNWMISAEKTSADEKTRSAASAEKKALDHQWPRSGGGNILIPSEYPKHSA